MTRRRVVGTAGALLALAAIVWGITRGLERLVTPRAVAPPAVVTPTGDTPIPRITATLFHAGPDGQRLVAVRREIPLADGMVAQGRAILTAQLEPPAAPLVSVIPPGTTLRAFYVTERRDAFVDLSREVSTGHPGGTSLELLTVSALVNAVVVNLPAVQRVQILIDGREADTLAGHVDLRRPLARDLPLLRDEVQ